MSILGSGGGLVTEVVESIESSLFVEVDASGTLSVGFLFE